MIKRMAVMLVLIGIVFGGIFGFQAFKSKMIRKYMSAGQPPQTVSTTKAEFQQWQTAERSVGTLVAVRGADLAPEVAGIVQSIQFKSGEPVKAGAPLVQLNADADVASLKALEATAALAEITYRRDMAQFKVKAVSQATLDADAAAVKSSTAQAEAQKALVAKKLIRAPFAGRAGIRAVDLGQYLERGNENRDPAGARPGVRRLPRAAGGARALRAGPEGGGERPTASPAGNSTAAWRRSTPRSIRRRATSKCARWCATRNSSCCRACSRRW